MKMGTGTAKYGVFSGSKSQLKRSRSPFSPCPHGPRREETILNGRCILCRRACTLIFDFILFPRPTPGSPFMRILRVGKKNATKSAKGQPVFPGKKGYGAVVFMCRPSIIWPFCNSGGACDCIESIEATNTLFDPATAAGGGFRNLKNEPIPSPRMGTNWRL